MKFLLTTTLVALAVAATGADARVAAFAMDNAATAPASHGARPVMEAQYYRGYPGSYGAGYSYTERCQEDLGYGRRGGYGCS